MPAGHNCLPPVRDRLAGRNDLHKGEHHQPDKDNDKDTDTEERSTQE